MPQFMMQNSAFLLVPLLQPELYDTRYGKHVLRLATVSRIQRRKIDLMEGSGSLKSEEESYIVVTKVSVASYPLFV